MSDSDVDVVIHINNGATLDKDNTYIAIPNNGKMIDKIYNPYDSYSLVIITKPNGEVTITNTTDFTHYLLNRVGVYQIEVIDRIGNDLTLEVEVVEL